MHSKERFGSRFLQKSARFGIDGFTDEIVFRRLSDVQFYCVIEFDEFDQVSLTFVFFLRRRGHLRRDNVCKKNKTKNKERKLRKIFFHIRPNKKTDLFEKFSGKRYFMY